MNMQSRANAIEMQEMQYEVNEVKRLIRFQSNKNYKLKNLANAQATFVKTIKIDLNYVIIGTDEDKLKDTLRVQV